MSKATLRDYAAIAVLIILIGALLASAGAYAIVRLVLIGAVPDGGGLLGIAATLLFFGASVRTSWKERNFRVLAMHAGMWAPLALPGAVHGYVVAERTLQAKALEQGVYDWNAARWERTALDLAPVVGALLKDGEDPNAYEMHGAIASETEAREDLSAKVRAELEDSPIAQLRESASAGDLRSRVPLLVRSAAATRWARMTGYEFEDPFVFKDSVTRPPSAPLWYVPLRAENEPTRARCLLWTAGLVRVLQDRSAHALAGDDALEIVDVLPRLADRCFALPRGDPAELDRACRAFAVLAREPSPLDTLVRFTMFAEMRYCRDASREQELLPTELYRAWWRTRPLLREYERARGPMTASDVDRAAAAIPASHSPRTDKLRSAGRHLLALDAFVGQVSARLTQTAR